VTVNGEVVRVLGMHQELTKYICSLLGQAGI